jgi:hypothetical protein
MAWDDTQTATDTITYTEWNNMVTYVKNPDEATSYSIDIASTPIITVEATGITVDGTITVGAYTLTIDETASLSDYLHTSGGTVTGDLTMSGADIVLGTQSIGYDNTGGLSFDADNNATLSGDLTVSGGTVTFDTNDYLEYDIVNDVLYGYIGGVQSLQIGGSAVNYCNFAGVSSGSSNSGNYSNGFGYYSLRYNSGDYSNGFGHASLRYNSGSYSNGFGYDSLQYNSGIASNGFGSYSLKYNEGDYSNGFGYVSLQYNTGNYSNGFGYGSLLNNSGSSSNGFGYLSLLYNEGDGNTAIGHNAFSTFVEDSGNAQEIESLTPASNQVTITGHGFGSAGDFVNLKISTTDTLPDGLDAGIDLWEVIDANTLECTNDSFTDSGTGTHTLTPQVVYTNSTALGRDAMPTASNQVMLGDSNVTEVYSSGQGNFNGLNLRSDLDLNDNVLQNAVISTTASATEGAIKWDSTNHKLLIYNGSAWETVTSST